MLGADVGEYLDELTTSLIEEGFLFEDNGILGIGERGGETFGMRHFMDLMAVFSEPPMLKVLAGRTEIGQVPVRLLTFKDPEGQRRPLLLGGRNWDVVDVDWRRGIVQVEPGAERGRARWFGGGRGLSFMLCQGMKSVLSGEALTQVSLSQRAKARLEQLRDEFSWVSDQPETVVLREPDGAVRWWTFAGGQANIWLAMALGTLGDQVTPGDLNIRLSSEATPEALREMLDHLDPAALQLGDQIAQGAIDRLKFSEALPEEYARVVVERRMRVDEEVRTVAAWAMRFVTLAD